MVGLHIVDGDLERLRDQVDWVGEDLGGLEAGVVGRVASGVPGARACGACAAASGAVGDWLSGLEGRYGAVSAGVRAMAAAYRADDDAQAGARIFEPFLKYSAIVSASLPKALKLTKITLSFSLTAMAPSA